MMMMMMIASLSPRTLITTVALIIIIIIIIIITATFLILKIIASGSKVFLSTCFTSNDPKILICSELKQHSSHMLLEMTKFKRNFYKRV